MKKFIEAIAYVEEQTDYEITYKGFGVAHLLTGTDETGKKKLAHIYGNDFTQLCHELGHLLATPGPRPTCKISLVLRELEAWRAGEFLMHKFDIEFDDNCFYTGIGTYINDLLNSEECPSTDWINQLIGE